jgi:hypothetical protein
MMGKRIRKVRSIKAELIAKARESMLSAVQIFNNPNILFKSESFVVLSIISWTYLMHAYYRDKKIDYRYYSMVGKKKSYDKTKRGAYKYWELERCLDTSLCPIDVATKDNLKFLIGLRHEIEHQMTTRIDDYLSARFQACCLNFNRYIKDSFGSDMGIDRHLSFSLQFSSIAEPHAKQLQFYSDLPENISSYIATFDDSIPDDEFNDPRFSYRVIYIPKTVNTKGQADKVIEFIPADSPEAQGLNKEYTIIKDREKPKFSAGEIVKRMKEKGYERFSMHKHTLFWKSLDAKNPAKGFGVTVSKTWYWYESWLVRVQRYCEQNKAEFSS